MGAGPGRSASVRGMLSRGSLLRARNKTSCGRHRDLTAEWRRLCLSGAKSPLSTLFSLAAAVAVPVTGLKTGRGTTKGRL